MIYDLKAKQKDMTDMLDSVQKLIDENSLEGMFIVIKDTKEKKYTRYYLTTQDNLTEWIGAIQIAKSDLIDSALYD